MPHLGQNVENIGTFVVLRLLAQPTPSRPRLLADAGRLPFDDETFDVAFLVTVLGEVVDRATALGELGRVVCPAGWLSITEQAGDPDSLPLTALQAEVEQAGFELSETYRRKLSYTANFRKRAAES